MIDQVRSQTCPPGVDWDQITKKNEIYRMTNKIWSPRVDDELGNYDYLLGADVRPNTYLWGERILTV